VCWFFIYKGELWKAKNLSNTDKTNEKILKGDKVKIKGRDGYILSVEKI